MWPTIIISVILAVLVLAIIVNEIVKKKNGKGSCSCGCEGCSLKDNCHNKKT